MVKKAVLIVLGFGILTYGVILTLSNWLMLAFVFQGVIGPVMAVGGLIVLALCKD